MADPRFFTNYGPYTIKDLAKIAKAEIGLDSDPDKLIYDVSPLETSDSKSIACSIHTSIVTSIVTNLPVFS